MRDAFRDFADGKFEEGLRKLHTDEDWHDDNTALDGPFYLGFLSEKGFGEGLLIASLLKRHTSEFGQTVKAFSQPKLCSILTNDPAFRVEPLTVFDEPIKTFLEAKSKGARSPLAILRRALTGDLLGLPFRKIDPVAARPQEKRTRPLIGIAWRSVQHKAIDHKSIPLEDYMGIFKGVDAYVISFQRKPHEDDHTALRRQFDGRCLILTRLDDAEDQPDVVKHVQSLDCMVTISTTTAHIAASLGVPVVLLAARRPHQQWFWRAQREHGKNLYPTVDVILGGEDEQTWWSECLEPAHEALSAKLGATR